MKKLYLFYLKSRGKPFFTLLLPLILIVLIFTSFNCKKDTGKKVKWINAESGLNLRNKPSLSAKILGLMPFGDKVKILSEKDGTFEIKDPVTGEMLKGKWTKVQWKNRTGWAFDAFLTGFEEYREHMQSINVCAFIYNPFSFKLKFPRFSDSASIKNIIINQFGKPKNISVTKTPNRHNPRIEDLRYKLEYKEILFIVYHAVAINKQILEVIEINGDSHKYKFGISFDMRKKDIEGIFGGPGSSQKNTLGYLCSNGSSENLYFTFDHKKLDKITILTAIE